MAGEVIEAARRRVESLVPARRLPAFWFVVVYCVLLVGIPSRLIVGPIGAAGTPANLWGLFALLWWSCVTIGGANPARENANPVRFIVGLFAVCIVLSYVTAMVRGWYVAADVREATSDIFDLAPAGSIQVRTVSLNSADRGLISFGAWLGIALVTCDGLRSWSDVDRLVRWVTGMGAFLGAVGLIQFFSGWNIAGVFKLPGLVAHDEFGAIDARSVVRRVYATAIHPIEFGVVLAAIFPLALHRVIHGGGRKSTLVVAVLIGFAIPTAVSRSAILVLAVTLLLLFAGWPPAWRVRAIVAAPIAVASVRLLMPGVVGTTVAFFTHLNQDPSVSGRTDDYDIAFREAAGSPIFGRGLFTFVPRFYRILDNEYLLLYIEIGLVGALALIAMFVVSYSCARGARRRTVHAEQRHLCLALSASIVGLAVSYATFDAWGAQIAAGITFVLAGLAGAVWRIARAEGALQRRDVL